MSLLSLRLNPTHQNLLGVFVSVLVVAKVIKTLVKKEIPTIEVTFREEEEAALHDDNKQTDETMVLVEKENSETLLCYDPSSAKRIGVVKNMDEAEVEEILIRAKKAQKRWSKSTFAERRRLLRMLLKYYANKSNQEKICQICVRDSGKTMFDAMLGEIVPTCEKLRWTIAEGEKVLQSEERSGLGLLSMHKKAILEYHPVGVLGVIAPFNYPAHNMLNHIISGLFAGNAVVTKVSEHTSFCGSFLIRPVQKALTFLGYPEDTVQLVTGLAQAGKALVESKNVDKIVFTGSDAVGKLVMRGASNNLTPVVLELGGKDPFVICADVLKKEADLAFVKNIAMRGVFQNNGQNCVGAERLFVEKDGYETFVQAVTEDIKNLRQGVPGLSMTEGNVDLGALTVKAHLDYLKSLVDDAVSKGARLLVGGKPNEKLLPGAFFEPTLLVDVTPEMDIFRKEAFGPIMTIINWDSEEDLLEMINSSEFALGSSVFCFNGVRNKRLTDGIEAGMSNMNDFGANYLCQCLPFGGMKNSGFGRFAGVEGLRACCRMKSVTKDKFPFIRTTLPKPLAYPVSPTAANIMSDLLGFAYATSLLHGVNSLSKFVLGLHSSK